MRMRRVLLTVRCDQQGGGTDMSRGGCSHWHQCLSYVRDNLQVEQGVMVRCSEKTAPPQAQAATSRSLVDQAEEEAELGTGRTSHWKPVTYHRSQISCIL